MSVQNEIERINNNVQAALSVVADAGVSVPENANSNNLPAAVSALANEKQDKLTGTKGQIVGFDSDGKPVAQDKTSYGVATLGADGKLTGTQVPMQQIIAVTNAAEYSATATYALGDYCTYDGKLYRCTTVITEAEAWTAAHWTETTMGAELVSIYTTLQKKADKSVAFTVVLTAVGWADNAQTVSNEKFMSAGYAYTVAPASGSFADYADAMVYADDVTTNGQMVFHCDSAPTANLTVNILRMVTAE